MPPSRDPRRDVWTAAPGLARIPCPITAPPSPFANAINLFFLVPSAGVLPWLFSHRLKSFIRTRCSTAGCLTRTFNSVNPSPISSAMADDTYAELCAVKAAILAKVPKGLDLLQAAALPLVTTTGNQLLLATGIKAGQTVLVVGAAGSVGRSAVFTAKACGATVIAGVLKRQIDDAKTVGADQVVATDDDTAIANLLRLEAVADAVGGRTAQKLIAKVKPGGVYASVVGAPQNAPEFPSVKVVAVFSKFDRKTLEFMADAVRDGKLVIPISQTLPLSEAAEAQAAAEKGGIGKILLVP